MTLQMLQQFTRLTEFLGRVLGPDYEIALYDLADREHSLVAIANGSISGREVGAPLSKTAVQMIADHSYQNANYRIHYNEHSSRGTRLRSSTFFIKDDSDELVGLLCINFDDGRYRELGEKILSLCHSDIFVDTNFQFDEERLFPVQPAKGEQALLDGASGNIHSAVATVLQEMGLAHGRLTLEERMEAINRLDEKGVFLLKGAVKDVAIAIGSSPASVYRYLSKRRQQR